MDSKESNRCEQLKSTKKKRIGSTGSKSRHTIGAERIDEKSESQKEFGPLHWTSIWKEQVDFGTDWQEPVPEGWPMSRTRMKMLKAMTSSKIPRDERVSTVTDIKFVDVIGEGNFSQVWSVRVRMEGVERRVMKACKLVNMAFQDTFDTKNYEEMYALRWVKHEHIVKVEDIVCIPDSQTGYPFSALLIFFELCGGTLKSIKYSYNRPKKHMSEEAVKYWFRQIGSALQFLHGKHGRGRKAGGLDMAHGDVHAGNIFYVQKKPKKMNDEEVMRFTFKLGDFGEAYAKNLDNKRRAKSRDVERLISCLIGCLRLDFMPVLKTEQDFDDKANETGLSVEVLNLVNWSNTSRSISIKKVMAHPWLSHK